MDYNIIKDVVKSGDLQKVRELCLQGADEYEGGDPTGELRNELLLLAVWHGHKDVAAYLLDRGASINCDGFNGHFPLFTAAMFGHTELAAMLIERGADVNKRNDNGSTALHRAMASYHSDKFPERDMPRYAAIMEMLLNSGADINAKDDEAETLLHKIHADVNMAEFLITRGADVNAKNVGGWTPLHLAASNGQPGMAALLIAHGADINAQMNGGLTPLAWAQNKGNAEIAEMLLSHQHSNVSQPPNAQPKELYNPAPRTGSSFESPALGKKEPNMQLVKNGAIVAAIGLIIGLVSSLGVFNWITLIGIGVVIYGYAKGKPA